MERLIENVITLGIAEYQLQIGNLDFGARIAITKKPNAENWFRIDANNQHLEYEVYPDINDGDRRRVVGPESVMQSKAEFWKQRLELIFAADRIYGDN